MHLAEDGTDIFGSDVPRISNPIFTFLSNHVEREKVHIYKAEGNLKKTVLMQFFDVGISQFVASVYVPDLVYFS